MKFGAVLTCLTLMTLSELCRAAKFATRQQGSPIGQVVQLLAELKSNIEADGVAEQTSYDKFACWCEDTLGTKAQDISKAKDSIEELRNGIVKLRGDVAVHGTEIKQLEKDIAVGMESEKEAAAIREKESAGYVADKTESEQCIGALEAAINVLSGSGGKKGFLETLHEAQLLSVVAGVRGLLGSHVVERSVPTKDLQVVRHFVERPGDFVGGEGSSALLSAAQLAAKKKSPYGDYAPQSVQIQGILKGMYDSFHRNLEKNNADEADKQKAFEQLMETKRQELATLRSILATHTTDKATKTKTLADSRVELQDTQRQLDADEVFFTDTKQSCQGKAGDWALRTRLRTEELSGIAQAIAILSSEEAKEVFANASSNNASLFLQLSSQHAVRQTAGPKKHYNPAVAYAQLKGLVRQYHSTGLAKIAARVKAGGQFDEIIVSIDNMIKLLQEEEQQDIKERDWCEARTTKNANDIEDLGHDITKAGQSITRMGDEVTALNAKLTDLGGDINATSKNLQELLDMRIAESAGFVQGVKDDAAAIELLGVAIDHLTSYYNKEKPGMSLAQHTTGNATEHPPETTWSTSYRNREGEGRGIIAILTLIKEDLEREITTAREDEATAQTNYDRDSQALRGTLGAQTRAKTELEKTSASLGLKIDDTERTKGAKQKDLTAENKQKTSLELNCAWVESHFASRREKRKKEIAGLFDAKNFLAGV